MSITDVSGTKVGKDVVRYASFRYDLYPNLGDEIQTLAVEQYLPRVDSRIDRDSLASFEAEEKHIVIFQGWFSHTPERCFPPSNAIVPVFVGFHLSDSRRTRDNLLVGPSLTYLKAHAPIGCRDEGTQRLLEGAGVRAYTTHCLTLTFPARNREPQFGKVFIVDGEDLRIPRLLRQEAVHLSHECSASLDDELKRAAAQRLLDLYRDEADLVVTTRLHCALPCIAMGIPVVFFGDPNDYRLGVLRDLRVPINRRLPEHRLLRKKYLRVVLEVWRFWNALKVDWHPRSLRLEKEKSRIRETVQRELRLAQLVAASQEANGLETEVAPEGSG